MKKKFKQITILVAMLVILTVPTINFSHGGRTDSSGGHNDNQNKSGLGGYHYHCGGYPAHLHTGGVCPYSPSAPASTSSSSSSSSTRKTVPTKVNARSIELDITKIDLLDDASQKITATVLPENTTDKTVTWTSSDENIAKVDENGNITAINPGTCLITVETTNGKSESVSVTVSPILVSEIKVDVEEVVLDIDESIEIHATIIPDNATDKTLSWNVEDINIATIEDGKITAKAEGTTKVICKSTNGITKEINVTVESTTETSADVTEDNTEPDSLGTMIGLAIVVGVPAYIISKKKK